MLASKGSLDGMFVVRPHSSKPNHYALTVMYQMVPYHFEIVSQVRTQTHTRMYACTSNASVGKVFILLTI